MRQFLDNYLFRLSCKDGFSVYRIAANPVDLRSRYGDYFVDHFDSVEPILYITPRVLVALECFELSDDYKFVK